MKEGIIILPEEIVNGIELGRNECLVGVIEKSMSKEIKCSHKNKRTPNGCGTRMHSGEYGNFHGCALRDGPKPMYVLDHRGIVLIEN